jgi:hypothetical protein
MGGGDLIAPAQVLPDFLEDRISGEIFSHLYKLSPTICCEFYLQSTAVVLMISF